MQNSFNKYGEENFSFKIEEVVENDSKEEALKLIKELELFYIQKEEEKFNLSNSAEAPTNYIFYGKENGFFGKKHTEETKQLQRLAKLGMYDGEKNPFYGKKHSIETKRRISQANEGKLAGIPKTEDQKRKMRESSPRNVKVSVDGVIYQSFSEASRSLGINRKTVSNRARNPNFPNYLIIEEVWVGKVQRLTVLVAFIERIRVRTKRDLFSEILSGVAQRLRE